MSVFQMTCFIVILVIFILIFFFFTQRSNSVDTTIEDYFKPGVDHDTIYFRVIDENGVESYIHDSGIKPEMLNGKVKISVVKKEYNNGNVKNLERPVIIKYGRQIMNLDKTYKIPKDHLKDNKLHYTITIDGKS